MGRYFRVSIPHTSRSNYHLRWRFAVILFILILFQQHRLFSTHRQSLAAKYSSTYFHDTSHPRYSSTSDESARFQNELIAHREEWKVIGEGWEGKVFVYNDSVIKRSHARSPFRNCAPGTTNEKWPTEIAASLRLGGDGIINRSDGTANTMLDGFLSVKAHFKASTSPSKPPEWHLVTPLLHAGNLNTLAKTLAQDTKTKNFREIDTRNRPVFERLLRDMQRLHETGYCHDDIKPANIFVENETNWILGDLGNIRHIAHPYHSSLLWLSNEQLQDCRANDVMRALKSYMKFIKMSASNPNELNEVFFEGREPLSSLFWAASAEAPNISAAQLRRLSLAKHPEQRAIVHFPHKFQRHTRSAALLELTSRRRALHHAVEHTIQTRIGEKVARWWAMVYIFGVPVPEICGF